MLKRKQKVLNKIFIIAISMFILLQPVFELKIFNRYDYTKILGFKMVTFFRFLLFGVVVISFLLSNKIKKKHIKYWMIYIGLIFIYLIGNYINSKHFYTYNPNGFNYSIKEELFYILRMMIPICTIYMIYCSNMTKKQIKNILIGLSLMFSLNIVLSNIFKIGYGTYTLEKIKGNIFSWFYNKENISPYFLSTRGLFYDSIISVAIVAMLSSLIYLYIKEKKLSKLLVFLSSILALVMIGTYASTFSTIILLFLMTALYIFNILMEHIKIKKGIVKENAKLKENESKERVKTVLILILLILINAVLIIKGPAISKKRLDRKQVENSQEKYYKDLEKVKEKEKALLKMKKEEQLIFFDKEHKNMGFPEDFIMDYYSYKYDPEFWVNQVKKREFIERCEQRGLEKDIYDRIFEVSNNVGDKFFGIGFSRAKRIFTLERDFIAQYYSVGIIGSILILSPYVLILLGGIYIILKQGITNISLKTYSLVLGIGLALCCAVYSGNAIENFAVNTTIAFLCGILAKNIETNRYLLKEANKKE